MTETTIVPFPAAGLTGQGAMRIAAVAADHAAAGHVFADYLQRRAANTVRRQRADLQCFADFLAAAGVVPAPAGHQLQTDSAAWQGVSWGLVEAFREWQLRQGYAMGSVNVRLSTVKTYARLAGQAGAIDVGALALIRTVAGYSRREARQVDERRAQRRLGLKKATAVPLTKDQAEALKDQPASPQGRRDAVIMALLLDHGLRVGEVAALRVGDVDLQMGTLHFYRQKVDKAQTHRLTADALRSLCAWFEGNRTPPAGPLLRASRKNGELAETGMSARAITARVRLLGEAIGVAGLSAHDCRHYWATRAAGQGTDPFALQEAGGWNSLAMPRRYIEAAKVANERVRL